MRAAAVTQALDFCPARPRSLRRRTRPTMPLSARDLETVHHIATTDWSRRHLSMARPEDIELAARAVALGFAMFQGFGNMYSLSAHPCRDTVRRINVAKGRPADQVGSVVTVREHFAGLFDWSRLPLGLSPRRVLDVMDALLAVGPFGFRGPADARLPEHLTSLDGDVRTVQLVAPGYRCPSNQLIAACVEACGESYLYGTSANRSRHLTGAADEPPHVRVDTLQREFGRDPGFFVVAHDDDRLAQRRHPALAPMSTTILSFHKPARDAAGRPLLTIERHGSFDLERVAPILEKHGFGYQLGSKARVRLARREGRRAGGRLLRLFR